MKETKYMKNKKVHKLCGKGWNVSMSPDPKVECKMHNKSAAFKWSARWKEVDCVRCLEKKP